MHYMAKCPGVRKQYETTGGGDPLKYIKMYNEVLEGKEKNLLRMCNRVCLQMPL